MADESLEHLRACLDQTEVERQKVSLERDTAYTERARLVSHLASLYPSVLVLSGDETGWPLVYLSLPTGQASWHVNPDDLSLFDHVARGTVVWDGHTTEEKYRRLTEANGFLRPPELPKPRIMGTVEAIERFKALISNRYPTPHGVPSVPSELFGVPVYKDSGVPTGRLFHIGADGKIVCIALPEETER